MEFLSPLFFQTDYITLKDVGYVVLDEADTMFAKEKGFEEDLQRLFSIMKACFHLDML